MKWIGISGSWRATSPEVEADVRSDVQSIIEHGDGIVTGGALNVDWFATDEALKHDPSAKQIKVIIPTTLALMEGHYRKRADEGVITHEQAEMLVSLLRRLQKANPEALIETPNVPELNVDTYYDRNTKVIEASDELHAFQVNGSAGTQNTINKARAAGLPVTLKSYTIS